MKKTLLTALPFDVPQEWKPYVTGAQVYDSSCSPEARVYFLDKDNGYYLKTAARGTLLREAQMTAYFHSLRLGTEVLRYCTAGDTDLLLTARMPGEDCLYADYIGDPRRLCDTLATALRALHETDHTGCPVMNRTAEYIAMAETNYATGHYDMSMFPDSFGFRSPEQAMRVLEYGKDALRCDTLLHGDYCLPNILLDRWKLSGFIDLGRAGVGDRHIDLFWGTWTLWFNLKTDAYCERFLDAYGRDRVDKALLRVVAAAEVFG